MFSIEIICYLFLGGTGAGALLALGCLGLAVPHADRLSCALGARAVGESTTRMLARAAAYRAFFAPAYLAALAFLALGVVFLACDLGRLDRMALLLVSPKPSYIALGTYALGVCLVAGAALCLSWGGVGAFRRIWVCRALEATSVVAGVTVMVYTGLLLSGMRSIPLWNTGWLTLLFALSSASCGIGLVTAAAELSGAAEHFAAALRRLSALEALLVVLEALAAALVLGHALHGAPLHALGAFGAPASGEGLSASGQAGLAAALRLCAGDWAAMFWGGFVACGLALPLALIGIHLVRRRHIALLGLATAACTLAGGAALRLCIVEAAVRPLLTG